VTFSAVTTGLYTVNVKNPDGCISPGTNITMNTQPTTPEAPTADLIHPTCAVTTGSISISAPAGTGISYSIDGSDYTNTTGVFTLVPPGAYTVTARNSEGCTSVPSSVLIIEKICADLTVINTVNNTYPLIGNTVVFTVAVTNNGPNDGTGVTVADIVESGYTYVSTTATNGTYDPATGVWTIDSLNNGASDTLTITTTVNSTGSYVSTATIEGNEDDGNIDNNSSTTITYPNDFFIPEGFSPNGDGINDLYVIRGILYFPANSFVIFNRWGNTVFEASPYKNTWDGRSDRGLRVGGDDELPTGTYFYLLDLGNGSDIIKGTIYLNR
jgi:gliding motility-associated-like protein/uncharacterized repeat protein (TIGR01451 family)